MKRILLFVFAFMILVTSCKNTDEIMTDISLTDIMKNKIIFNTEIGEKVYFSEYTSPNMYEKIIASPTKYAFINFDNDEVIELVLYVENWDRYIVFHKESNEVYAFEFVSRAMIDLKTDGSFIQSEGAGINSYSRLSFNKNKYEVLEEAYSNDMDNVYRINEKVSTSEKVNNYKQNFEEKDSVSWNGISD